MKVDEKITLDDNSEFLLLSESNIDGSKYFLAVEIKDGNPTEHYELYKEVKDGDDFLVEEVQDEELRDKLIDDIDDQLEKAEDEEELNSSSYSR